MNAPTQLLIPFTPAELRHRHDGWTAERQIAFIEALAETACVAEACRRVGMSETSAQALRRRPCAASFREAWDIAADFGAQLGEQAAWDRIIRGVPRPVFYKGVKVGEWRHYDERLTMFMLRHRRPHRFGKWLERASPPDLPPLQLPADETALDLDDKLDEIERTAPIEHGNPL